MKKLNTNNDKINGWIRLDPIRTPRSPEFCKIIEFYLFNSPVRGLNYYSARSISEYGWEKSKLSKLKKLLLFDNDLAKRFYICRNSDEVELTILNNRIFGNQFDFKEIIVALDNKESIVESILYVIRCALAHRSFLIKKHQNTKYYFMANVDRGKIKGRLILKESTLLNWISIIKGDL